MQHFNCLWLKSISLFSCYQPSGWECSFWAYTSRRYSEKEPSYLRHFWMFGFIRHSCFSLQNDRLSHFPASSLRFADCNGECWKWLTILLAVFKILSAVSSFNAFETAHCSMWSKQFNESLHFRSDVAFWSSLHYQWLLLFLLNLYSSLHWLPPSEQQDFLQCAIQGMTSPRAA